MCTVTYLPLADNNFILTSNRDETPFRSTLPPKKYIENGVTIIYPKDELAGGTWIGLSDKKRLVCLLNGGFEKHQRKDTYRLSRGVIVKKILSEENAHDFITNFNFEEIEPFTLVLVAWQNQLETYELVWDGETKHFKKLKQEAKIWSSSTLYTKEMKVLRQNWFSEWKENTPNYLQENILNFHANEGLGTVETSPKMKRKLVETVSITSVAKEGEAISIVYKDYLAAKTQKTKLVVQL